MWKDNKSSSFTAENWGLVLVGIYAIAFVIMALIFSLKYSFNETLPRDISIILQSDSTVRILAQDKEAIVDSLNQVMLEREHLLATRYQALIQKEENNDTIFTVCSILIGMIASLLGFFGIKNFQSIREESKKIVKDDVGLYLKNHTQECIRNVLKEPKYFKEIIKPIQSGVIDNFVKKKYSPKKLEKFNDSMYQRIDELSKEVITLKSIIGSQDKSTMQAINDTERKSSSSNQTHPNEASGELNLFDDDNLAK